MRKPLENRDFTDLAVCDVPDAEYLEDGPLWGQYNRIFPVKIVVRQLANMILQYDTDRIDLEVFRIEVASNARELGLELREIDNSSNRGRGEKLSSGLPIGSDANKSMNRFKTQFVGDIDQSKHLSGAAPSLQFIEITSEEDNHIGLTDYGVLFAGLYNPLLDESLRSDIALSDKEREFYLEHISHHLPDEFAAMQTVADGIQSGADRPDALTEHVVELNGDWTDAQANTIRTGLVSRMYELGLITRERVGQRGVAYRLTNQGEEHLLQAPEKVA